MKKLLILPIIALLCGCEGCNKYKCQQAVEKAFPNAKIYRIQYGFDFIVEDSLHLYHVKTVNPFSAEITDVITLR